MKSTDSTNLIGTVIASGAASGYVSTIPTEQATAGNGTISLTLGSPPECAISVEAGGKRPLMKDVNGVYRLLSAAIQSVQSWGILPFSSDFAADIGGYPDGAICSDGSGLLWVSTADDNTTTPGATDATWTNIFSGYVAQYADAETYDVSKIGINKSTGNLLAYVNGTWLPYQPAGDYATKESIGQFLPCGGSTTLTVPSWATRFEYILTGGGGGGADCQASGSTLTSTNASGGGGGAGGTAIGLQTVTPGSSLSVTIGAGGQAEYDGGASSISYSGITIATANGGGGAKFSSTALSAGGSGGSASASNGSNVTGGNGSDGQNGSFVFAGNGGGSYWGGGARAGSLGGISGAPFGAGGGGAYDSTFTGTYSYGGYGSSGFLLYRWLP